MSKRPIGSTCNPYTEMEQSCECRNDANGKEVCVLVLNQDEECTKTEECMSSFVCQTDNKGSGKRLCQVETSATPVIFIIGIVVFFIWMQRKYGTKTAIAGTILLIFSLYLLYWIAVLLLFFSFFKYK